MPLSTAQANVIGRVIGTLPATAGRSVSTGSSASQNSAINGSQNTSQSQSATLGSEATQRAVNAANVAYERQKELAQMQMEYNAREAQKQRDWETDMANTIYTRSVKNMREAGLNPILAANMGLSGASVGSGATASISGMTAPMSQTFADSVSSANSQGSSWGQSQGTSYSQNMSNSLYGIEEVMNQLGNVYGDIADAITNSKVATQATAALDEFKDTVYDDLPQAGKNIVDSISLDPKDIAHNFAKLFSFKPEDWLPGYDKIKKFFKK